MPSHEMNRVRLASALAGLALGLLFYLAHRTDQTLGNHLVARLCGPAAYLQLKHALREWLPAPSILIGCLPSALWCFLVSSLTGGWRVLLGSHAFPLAWLAPLFNAGWEIVQRLGWTDGHGDWRDAVAGVAGWLLAEMAFAGETLPPQVIPLRWNWRVAAAATGFASMGLADVWK